MHVMLQHNLAALQAQVESLQLTNSVLTRDLCLKENYIQLKDQQFRVMQRRLEELEGDVAQWKDRWLQQVNAQQVTHERGRDETGEPDNGVICRVDDATWTPWKCKSRTLDRTKAVAKAIANVANLSRIDRHKVQPLLVAIEQDGSTTVDDLVFADVSEDLSRMLLLDLLPALRESMDRAGHHLQCFSRAYYKQTMDIRVQTHEVVATKPLERSVSFLAADKSPRAASSSLGASSSADTTDETLELAAHVAHETEATEAPLHLFDCIELDRRGLARPSVRHGPRELHATKAMFVSQPLTSGAATQADHSPRDHAVDSSLDHASRRYTLTPKRSGPTFAVETKRTHTMTMGALPSPAQSPLSRGMLMKNDSLSIMPSREKDGKIKKIVGSVMDRLSRHKSQLSLPTTSSSHASPGPASGSTGGRPDRGHHDDDDSICDGCGRGSLVGVKWTCRSCRLVNGHEYALCDKCYGQGLHGKEQDSVLLFARVEAIIVQKCPQLAHETALLRLLRMGICKANLQKFSFGLKWIADVLQCHRTMELRARALEIANVPSTVRSEFARRLRELLTRYRPDIELTIEWEPAASGAVGPNPPGMRGNEILDELDILRIRVKDAAVATTSSFHTTTTGTLSMS